MKVFQKNGRYIEANSTYTAVTGCSSSGRTLVPGHQSTSLEGLANILWAPVANLKVVSEAEAYADQIAGAFLGVNTKLSYVWGNGARMGMEMCAPLLKRIKAVALLADGEPVGLFASTSPLRVGNKNYAVPTFMIDPQKSCSMINLYRKAAVIDKNHQTFKPKPLSQLTVPDIRHDVSCISTQKKLLKHTFMHANVSDRWSRASQGNWNPDYDIVHLPWWERARLGGYRVPHASHFVDIAFSSVKDDHIHMFGGNYGALNGFESCRPIIYLQNLAVKHKAVMGSVFHEEYGVYSAPLPIVYRSTAHRDSVVGCAFFSRKPLEWVQL